MTSPASSDTGPRSPGRQQRVLAELGQRALATDDVEQLLRDASRAVADALDVEYCGAFELVPERDELSLREGVGWNERFVGSATVPTGEDSLPGATLQSGAPVVVENVRNDVRFGESDLFAAHDVDSGLCVVIGTAEDPWGALCAQTAERRDFDESAVTFLRSVANVLASALDNERTKRRLREKERRTDQVLETSPVGIVTVDADGEVRFANERAAQITGRDREEIVAMAHDDPAWDLVTPSGDPMPEERLPFNLLGDDRSDVETDIGIRRPDGTRVWVSVTGTSLSDSAGNPDGAVFVVEDVTEDRERERDRDRVYRALETTGEGISLLDGDGRFVYVNRAYADLYGYDPEEMIGEHWDMLYPEGDADEIYEEVLPTLAEHGTWSDETIGLRSDGTTFVEDHRLATTADGGMVCTVRDATEEREHRRRLEAQEAALRETYEVISDMERSFDEKVDALLGIGRDVVGTEYAALSRVEGDEYHFQNVRAPDDSVRAGDTVPLSSTNCERVVATGERLALADVVSDAPDLADRAGNAEWGIACYLGAPVFLDGEVYGTCCFYDTSARNESFSEWEKTFVDLLSRWISYELERKARERELAASNERLEQFAYAASHDLQEPLRMVSSYLQLIERRYAEELDADGREFIEFAVDGATRMREMIDALLRYSRVETEGDPLEPLDLNDVLDAAMADLAMMIEESGAEITIEDLPRVEGDSSQLRQVFQNLLDNAIQYSAPDPPRVTVSARREGSDWIVDVRDEGVGIDPGSEDRIFEVFQRLHTAEEHPGTGIGLALCQRIVERHGGEIWVDSEPGEGSTFSIRLPEIAAGEP